MNKRKTLTIIICVVGFLASLLFYSYNMPQPRDISSEILDPVSGEQTVTVVPVITSGLKWTLPEENITRNVFVNVSDYFFEQSYGKVYLTGRISSPVYLQKSMSFYARGSMNSYNQIIAKNATEGAQLFVNDVFSQLSWSSENITIHVILMYAGRESLHPHHYHRDVMYDGQTSRVEYSVVPENGTLATIAHEVAHGFGLDDLYNKDEDRDSEPVGTWGLMSYGDMYNSISDMCGYSRMRLGWVSSSQIAQVSSDSVHTLDDLNTMTSGTKLLCIRLDDYRYFLIESRIEHVRSPGVLITLLDLNRPAEGYGRLEVVRPFDAVNVFSIDNALLREGEQYVDPTYSIAVRVLTGNSKSFRVEIEFDVDTSIRQSSLSLEGNVSNITTANLENSTLLFAASVFNRTSGITSVRLYQFEDSPCLIASSISGYDCINPCLLTYGNDYLMLYEIVNGSRHSVVAQTSYSCYSVSGADDARHPTMYRSWQTLYIAYENHTKDNTEIVLRSKSAYQWHDTSVPSPLPYYNVYPNINGTPHSPKLVDGNNDASLVYIRSSANSDRLEFRYDMGDTPYFSIVREHITSFDIYTRETYRSVFCLSDSTTNWCEIFRYDGYSRKMDYVCERWGTSIGVFGLLGVWQGYSYRQTFYLDRIWDAYREQGVRLGFALSNSTPVCLSLAAEAGSPCILLFSSSKKGIEITRFYISTLSIPQGNLLILPVFQLLSLTSLWSIGALFTYYHFDQRIQMRVSNLRHPDP